MKSTSDKRGAREAPDVNQEPEFESGITREVREDAGDGETMSASRLRLTTLTATQLTYSISGGADMGAFAITTANRSNGQITVKKGSTLNFEGSQTTFVVEVTGLATRSARATSTTVTIMVTERQRAAGS